MRIAAFAILACLTFLPALADNNTYRVKENGHVWSVTPVRVMPQVYSVILALDSRDAQKLRATARKIAGDYAAQNLPGCTPAHMAVLGRSGWRVDFRCPKSYRR